MWFDDDENPWSEWVSQHFPGTFAHPDAPAGGSGYGYSRRPGETGIHAHGSEAPDPHSPVGLHITPWEAAEGYAEYEFEKVRSGIRSALSWPGLREMALRALGPQSFALGACHGMVKNPAMSVGGLLQLQKMLIEADFYERLTRPTSWKTVLSPWGMEGPAFYQLAEVTMIKFHLMNVERLKASYEAREALIKEMADVFAHPLDFFAKAKDQMKASYVQKWNKYCLLQKQTDLKSQFEAGEIFGDVVMEVAMLILTVISVGGAAAKLAAKVPQLVQVTEFVRGARAAEVGGVAGEIADAAKGAEAAVGVAKTTSRVATKPNEAFFWSGNTNGVGGEKVAAEIAAKNNGVTLEALVSERDIEMPPFDRTNPQSVKAWEDISTEYADGASGEVRAVVGKQLRAGNIWENKELPALINNPNVTKITVIDPATEEATTIFSR